MRSHEGLYVVVEGTDGTGKSTQALHLRASLERRGLPVANFIVEEPNGAMRLDGLAWHELIACSQEEQDARSLVPAATALRKILKAKQMACTTDGNVLMFTASRQMNWEQAIKPALDRGEIVVTARNWLSTLAYQGYAEGGDIHMIEKLTQDFLGERYMSPDFQVILDLEDESERRRRLAGRDGNSPLDSFESRGNDFQAKVVMGYRAIAATREIPLYQTALDETMDETHARLLQDVLKLL